MLKGTINVAFLDVAARDASDGSDGSDRSDRSDAGPARTEGPFSRQGAKTPRKAKAGSTTWSTGARPCAPT